ncbi:MAG: ribosome small subunit-dependent GTPase A [Betaproteobacteria bacterium]|nr:ribosome small subunit-dependent GTPase A [Betaproteobacteria bacterium]MDE2122185.1 ribosome small subunit-dependent GTPase A [Betaproteobacteria bacterium]MDE2185597.1 ribosome small subunit-dependent GTPase A [Betaproteobacteria bacterium]MDE2323175.1 ribosome small subunit-dependent GTPase A [Betaproteobacteria bacterium]
MPDPSPQPARIVAAFGRSYLADTGNQTALPCVARGKRSEAVCGDQVLLRLGQDPAVIESILPRRNALWRQDAWRSKVFAANLDLVMVMTAPEPTPNLELVGRALIAAQAEGIPSALVLNKCELPSAAQLREQLQPLQDAGYPLIELSAKQSPEFAAQTLRSWLDGRVGMLIGASGVGKSTLANALVPGLRAQTQAISAALNAGRHTTTTTRLYPLHGLPPPSALLDSPGFQAFGLNQLSVSQLQHALPEIATLNGDCRFNNCTHRQEPGCAVRSAVDCGQLPASRYALYLRVLQELLDESSVKV